VGKGKGDCMPLDYRPPPPVKPNWGRQIGGFTTIAALLTLVGWVAYGMMTGDTRAGPPEAPVALVTPTAMRPLAAPAPSPAGGAAEAEPSARAAESQELFDCDADWDGTERGARRSWAPDKLAFCCEHRRRGCAPQSAAAPDPHTGDLASERQHRHAGAVAAPLRQQDDDVAASHSARGTAALPRQQDAAAARGASNRSA